MAIIIATIALLLCWIWIEITIYFTNENARKNISVKSISYKKFIWILRTVIITLFFSVSSYMYFFQNIKFQEAIQYCLGIIK